MRVFFLSSALAAAAVFSSRCAALAAASDARSTALGTNAAAPTLTPAASSSFLSSLSAGSFASARLLCITETKPGASGSAYHRHADRLPETNVSRWHMDATACQSVPGLPAMVRASPRMTHCRLARDIATLIRRGSDTNPTALRSFARVVLISTKSNSLP